MAALIEEKILFIHIPRCGGSWFYETMNNARVNFCGIGFKHGNYIANKNIFDLLKNKKIKSLSFIRHPAEWYKSYYELKNRGAMGINRKWDLYGQDYQWHPTWDIDNECSADTFDGFINNCINKMPSFVSYMYDNYLKVPPIGLIDYVVLTKNIENEVPLIFKENNISFNKDKFINYQSFNSFKNNKIKYKKELLLKILESEKRSIEKFKFTKNIDELSYLTE